MELNKIELLRTQKYRTKFNNSLGYLPEEIGIFSAIVIDDSGEYSKGGHINASVTKKGEKYTLTLSQNFSTLLSRDEKLFIISHEIGHVMSGHIGNGEGRSLKKELEADAYAASKIGRKLSARIFSSLMERGLVNGSKENENRLKILRGETYEEVVAPQVEEPVVKSNIKGGENMKVKYLIEQITKKGRVDVFETAHSFFFEEVEQWSKYLVLYNEPDYWTIAENLPVYSMKKGEKGTYLNLGTHRDFDIVAIYKEKEVKLWRVPSERFYEPSPRGYEQIVEHRGKEEVMISDNRQEGKFLSHNSGEIVGQGFYFGKTEKEFKLKRIFAEYQLFNSEAGYRVYHGLYDFLDEVIDFAEEQNLSLNQAAVKWADTSLHIAKINSEDSFTINLETKLLTQRSIRNGKVTLSRGVHPKSKPVMEFIRLLERNPSLVGSLKEDIEAFLLKEMDDSLKKEMSYIKDSYSLEELIVLSRYPNYLWVLNSVPHFERLDYYYLRWTPAVRQSKLMKKGEFLKRFMPRLGKKTANRLASSSIMIMPSFDIEDWPYAFMGRLADPKLLMQLGEKIAEYKGSYIKSCLYLDNQVHQGLSFFTLEAWLDRKGLSERLAFLINKVIQSNRGEREDLMELRDSMHILAELYESYSEVQLSELAGYRSIKDFHDALVRILIRQEREVSQVSYIYSKKAEDLTLKSGQWEIALPGSEADIVDAGDILNICVGSSAYTSRHNKDNFYILFLKERGRLLAVIELKNKAVCQFKFKYNNVFHNVRVEDKKGLSCFIKDWMEVNQLTDQSYDLAGLNYSTNKHLQVEDVNDNGFFEWAERELGRFDGPLPF